MSTDTKPHNTRDSWIRNGVYDGSVHGAPMYYYLKKAVGDIPELVRVCGVFMGHHELCVLMAAAKGRWGYGRLPERS